MVAVIKISLAPLVNLYQIADFQKAVTTVEYTVVHARCNGSQDPATVLLQIKMGGRKRCGQGIKAGAH